MVIGIFGESCTGKSTLAELLKGRLDAQIFTGKDYLRLTKNEAEAQRQFRTLLQNAVHGGHIIYVISEAQQLSLLPEKALRILVTADLETIKARFARRTGGVLPPPVAALLEKKHGCFDAEAHDLHVISGQTDLDRLCGQIAEMANPD